VLVGVGFRNDRGVPVDVDGRAVSVGVVVVDVTGPPYPNDSGRGVVWVAGSLVSPDWRTPAEAAPTVAIRESSPRRPILSRTDPSDSVSSAEGSFVVSSRLMMYTENLEK
jgi:hypothetical protein